MSCARGRDAPVERAEGDVRSVVTECDQVRSLQDKAPLGSSESACAAGDRVSLRDCDVTK